ncbi:nicotinate N-methyltransferase 1 isoform X1 [Beta vulgaris subsp. vulgaris]|uniref:nicotinate N-methyltransferase 1 isoform X1 n=1 Tax=Beta vulgaris subsp. vulgaris TaxID=3555 RepID=UPI002036BC26|nr:nicotinate N-methyltransferase 1 isoform X1 [Beta vulgaris subsp. vulgaris]
MSPEKPTLGTPQSVEVDETSETRNKARLAIMELANMISVPMALNAVVRLKVPAAIWSCGANTPLTAAAIISLILPNNPEADADNLARLLRLLSTYGVFSEHPPLDGDIFRRYSLTEVGRTLVAGGGGGGGGDDGGGSSHGEYVLQHHQEALVRAWLQVDRAVVGPTSKTPFEVANGEPAYDYYGKNEEMNGLMQRAMAGVSVPFMKAVVEGGYDGFDGVVKLVDVGGSAGDCLKMIMSKYGGIKEGINFDLPEVVAQAPQIPGVTHVGGDMFKSIPCGDAIFMKWVLTTWTDDEIKLIMKNCYDSLPAGGKLIACEPVLPETSDDSHRTRALLSGDIFVMTIYGAKGRHRMEEEYRQLGNSAGFPHFRAVHIDYFFTVLEFQK